MCRENAHPKISTFSLLKNWLSICQNVRLGLTKTMLGSKLHFAVRILRYCTKTLFFHCTPSAHPTKTLAHPTYFFIFWKSMKKAIDLYHFDPPNRTFRGRKSILSILSDFKGLNPFFHIFGLKKSLIKSKSWVVIYHSTPNFMTNSKKIFLIRFKSILESFALKSTIFDQKWMVHNP